MVSPLLMWLGLAGCIDFYDERFNPIPTRALDYQLDRPWVLAMNVYPPLAKAPEPVWVEPLVLGPRPIETITASVCGVRTDVPVFVYDLACFRNDGLVTPIDAALTGEGWATPELTEEAERTYCEYPEPEFAPDELEPSGEVACRSRLPILVEAFDGEEVGFGSNAVGIAHVATGTLVEGFRPGNTMPFSVNAPETATAGETVDLEVSIVAPPSRFELTDVRWYVDAGTLMRTGVTLLDALPQGLVAVNALEIPEDYEGTLRWVVVVQGIVWVVGEDGRYQDVVGRDHFWTVQSIEVVP